MFMHYSEKKLPSSVNGKWKNYFKYVIFPRTQQAKVGHKRNEN